MNHTHGGTPSLSGLEAAAYLRKSRVEEGLATDEVLAKHRAALYDYAAQHGIHIIEAYPEVVSGESLYARPEMLRLLQDVEEGRYGAVLCMDLDRLSRGRMKDQGIILDAFRDSGTLIITPEKVYDLTDELDDEIAEMKTFISRREYKIINKRLRRGLHQTIQAGAYVANAPYGYKKTVIDRKPTLETYEPEARFVRMMYEMYAQGYGCTTIARHVSALGARPHRSREFSRTSVAKILRSPTYLGKIVWDQKKHVRKPVDGSTKHIVIYQPPERWTVVDGLHPALVEKELFDQVQEIMAGRYRPSKQDGTVKSPLVGLIKCTECGQNMQRMYSKKEPYLFCARTGCCASTRFDLVEERVLQHLQEALTRLSVERKSQDAPRDNAVLESALAVARKELAAAARQKNRLYELLEMGEYDLPTYRERMAAVMAKLAGLERKEAEALRALEFASSENPAALAEKIRAVLDAYQGADAAGRNALLRTVIRQIWYTKKKKTKPADFRLRLELMPF